jgi:hypothetical protein
MLGQKNENPTLEKAVKILEEAGFRVFDITQRVDPGMKLSASEALGKSYIASFSITPQGKNKESETLAGTTIDRL